LLIGFLDNGYTTVVTSNTSVAYPGIFNDNGGEGLENKIFCCLKMRFEK